MEYFALLVCDLSFDLDSSRGSGGLDRLSDRMLRDIGLKRVHGRIVADDVPEVAAVQNHGWSSWPAPWATPARA